MSESRWAGRVALVTGASRGIGEAVVRVLVELGLRVVACGRDEARLEALAAELGEAVWPLAFDLRDLAAIEGAFAQVRARWGGVAVLVNNAGLGKDAPLLSGASDDWRTILEVNVLALCVCTREATADMLRAGSGHVIHVSSMSGHRVPGGGGGVYAASKHAVRALTEGLRRELRAARADGVRVTAVSPGYVATDFHQTLKGGDPAFARPVDYPMLSAADVAEAVRYALCAPAHVELHDVLMRPTQQET
ncbi:MAG: SDR family NAD(P)-dependent oxidoreductase [Planctomycetes bacterium]|nr:SDR family NAD(P)-dependent oxidoreductase [Planctomycetota bacterium]